MAGFVVAGVGTGTLVVPPIATALIFALGWRGSCRIFGATLLIFLTGLAQLFLRDPSRKDLLPFGSQQTPAGLADPPLKASPCAMHSEPGNYGHSLPSISARVSSFR